MKNILIIRLSSIGDILHTFTLLPDIKNALPDAKIDWLVDSNFRGIAELSPLIDNIISIPLRRWKINKFTWLFKLLQFKKNLPNKRYDYIIDTQGLLKSAVLAKLLFNGPIYGLDKNSARERLSSYFYDHCYQVEQNNVAVVRLRGLVAKIFESKQSLLDIDFRIKTSNYSIKSQTGYVLYLHGTSKAAKKWPLANWLELSNWLLLNSNKELVLTYSNPAEFNFSQELALSLNNPRLKIIPQLEFAKLSDLVNQADLVIGVDTGFTHLANLLGKATLAIYLHSRPEYVGMLESAIAHNFGGYACSVSARQLIDYIQKNKLLSSYELGD